MMGYDAMTFGNHEFDDGPEGVKPFVEGANYPILAANMDDSGTIGTVGRLTTIS